MPFDYEQTRADARLRGRAVTLIERTPRLPPEERARRLCALAAQLRETLPRGGEGGR